MGLADSCRRGQKFVVPVEVTEVRNPDFEKVFYSKVFKLQERSDESEVEIDCLWDWKNSDASSGTTTVSHPETADATPSILVDPCPEIVSEQMDETVETRRLSLVRRSERLRARGAVYYHGDEVLAHVTLAPSSYEVPRQCDTASRPSARFTVDVVL